jgi:hypothetical protein
LLIFYNDKIMVDYLTHYYHRDKGPFRSLSELSDDAAIKIMKVLCDDTPYGARFKDPAGYLNNRKQTEKWVRQGFIAKGGKPVAPYPIPFVLGSSRWLVQAAPDRAAHAEIRIPLSEFSEVDISFTYPDSMISRWFGRDRPAEYYLPGLHGIIFTLSEILALVDQKGMPEEDWDTNLPEDLAPYIEAQVWNHEPLAKYKEKPK